MRWDELFADLEGQLGGLVALDRDAEVAQRTRAEFARVRLVDRLRGSVGHRIRCTLTGAGTVAGSLERVAADFVLVAEARAEAVVPLPAIAGVEGLTRSTAAPGSAGAVASRLGLAAALRTLARDRSVIRVDVVGGHAVVGTPSLVGADYVEVAVHGADEMPRPESVRVSTLVPFGAVQVIRRPLEPEW